MTQPKPPPWVSEAELTPHELATLLAEPGKEFAASLAERLLDHGAGTFRSYTPANWEAEDDRWRLQPTEVEAIDEQRERLDTWWNELPAEVRDAFRGHHAGVVSRGEYREYVIDFGPGGEVDSEGEDLRGAFTLPKLIHAYSTLDADCEHRLQDLPGWTWKASSST